MDRNRSKNGLQSIENVKPVSARPMSYVSFTTVKGSPSQNGSLYLLISPSWTLLLFRYLYFRRSSTVIIIFVMDSINIYES